MYIRIRVDALCMCVYIISYNIHVHVYTCMYYQVPSLLIYNYVPATCITLYQF